MFQSSEVLCDQIRLYNLTSDPNEKNNLAEGMPEIVEMLTEKLKPYFNSMIPPHVKAQVIEGNPNLFENGGFWRPGWCTAEPETCTSNSVGCVF